MWKIFSKVTIIKVEKGSFFDSILSGDFYSWFAGYMGYIWLAVAIAFLFSELGTPGLFFFVSFSVGAIGAAVVAFLGFSVIFQCLFGLAVSLISFFLMRKYLKQKELSQVTYEKAKTNVEALVGSDGIVLEVIKPHGVGVVKVGGEKWRARVEDGVGLQKGAIVSVLRVEGNTVIVKSKISGE